MPILLYSCNASQSSGGLDCLRNADASLILEADKTIGSASFMQTWPFVPVVDGEFIRERPSKALESGKVNGVSPRYQLTVPKLSDRTFRIHSTSILIAMKVPSS